MTQYEVTYESRFNLLFYYVKIQYENRNKWSQYSIDFGNLGPTSIGDLIFNKYGDWMHDFSRYYDHAWLL